MLEVVAAEPADCAVGTTFGFLCEDLVFFGVSLAKVLFETGKCLVFCELVGYMLFDFVPYCDLHHASKLLLYKKIQFSF